MKLLVERFDSDKDATISTIYLDNVFQYFGLEDFMVLSEQSVCNAVHFSFFCANISQVLMKKTGEQSIIDLKLRYHGRYYATQILKIVSKYHTTRYRACKAC